MDDTGRLVFQYCLSPTSEDGEPTSAGALATTAPLRVRPHDQVEGSLDCPRAKTTRAFQRCDNQHGIGDRALICPEALSYRMMIKKPPEGGFEKSLSSYLLA